MLAAEKAIDAAALEGVCVVGELDRVDLVDGWIEGQVRSQGSH